jgi:hypothetical protein
VVVATGVQAATQRANSEELKKPPENSWPCFLIPKNPFDLRHLH